MTVMEYNARAFVNGLKLNGYDISLKKVKLEEGQGEYDGALIGRLFAYRENVITKHISIDEGIEIHFNADSRDEGIYIYSLIEQRLGKIY